MDSASSSFSKGFFKKHWRQFCQFSFFRRISKVVRSRSQFFRNPISSTFRYAKSFDTVHSINVGAPLVMMFPCEVVTEDAGKRFAHLLRHLLTHVFKKCEHILRSEHKIYQVSEEYHPFQTDPRAGIAWNPRAWPEVSVFWRHFQKEGRKRSCLVGSLT